MISSAEVAVVIQGPLYDGIENIVQRSIDSIQQYLPGAEIIISTTDKKSDLIMQGVKLIYSPPPPVFKDINGGINNVNRLILSVQAGLSAVTRRYAIKLRTDHHFESANILNFLENIEQDTGKASLFSAPVGLTNLFLRNSVKIPYLFHLSDTIQFGRTEDLQRIWAIDLVTKDEIVLKDGPRVNPFGTFQGYTSFRLLPEQSICLRFLTANGFSLDLKHSSHTSYFLLWNWEKILCRNFKVYDWFALGIKPPERFLTAAYSPSSVMSHTDFNRLKLKADSAGNRYWYQRYVRLLVNKYLLCWFNHRWLISSASLLLFTCSPRIAIKVRFIFRKVTHAR